VTVADGHAFSNLFKEKKNKQKTKNLPNGTIKKRANSW
jgi:hypothetical protein